MIIPANMAQGMRSMIGAVANGNAPAAANDSASGGDVHVHLHGAVIQNPSQLKQFFKDNHQAVGAGVRQFVRQGGNTAAFR